MAINKGNPNHDEEGKFTTSNNNQGRRLDDPAHNPFKKKGQGPFADPDNEMENAWADLFGLGQKIIDDRKKEMHKNDNSIEDKLGKMGFAGDEKTSDLRSKHDALNEKLENIANQEKEYLDNFSTSPDGSKLDGWQYKGYDIVQNEDGTYDISKEGKTIKDKLSDEEVLNFVSGKEIEPKTEKDIKEFEDTHPFEVVYDYDENGNKNGYELKFKNSKDQEEYEKLLDEVYGN